MNKMTKQILIAVVTAGLVFLAWVLFLFFRPTQQIESILPADALMYVRLSRPVEHWKTFAKSEFYQNIATIKINDVLRRNHFSDENVQKVEQVQVQVDEIFKNPFVQKFLSKEIALAVYMAPSKNSKVTEEVGSVFVVRLTPLVQMVESFSRFFSQWGKDVSIRKENDPRAQVVHINIKGHTQGLKYVRYQDMMIIAYDEEKAFNRLLDVIAAKAPALLKDEDFKLSRARAYSKGDGFLYVNMKQVMGILLKQPKADYSHITGLNSYAMSFLPGSIPKWKIIVGLDKGRISPNLAQWTLCKPQSNPSLPFIPSGVILYQWSGCHDYVQWWRQARKSIVESGLMSNQFSEIKTKIEERLGFKISEDVLPILGDEAGGYLTDVDTLGVFPFPRFLSFIKINDIPKAQSLLDKFTVTPFGKLQHEEYENVKITYFALPLGANMDPGYCFLGDYFLFASSRQLLKKSIDTFKDSERSIKADRTYALFGLNQINQVQQLWYVRIGELAKRLSGLMNWSDKYFNGQVSLASSYAKEGEEQKQKLLMDMAQKSDELTLAKTKLNEWQAKSLEGLLPEDADNIKATVTSLSTEVYNIEEEIRMTHEQEKEINEAMALYDAKAQQARLFMFNAQNVLKPILKGFESLNAQGGMVNAGPRYIETELMFN